MNKRLSNYLLSGRIHSSLLFIGPEIQVKLETAKKFAQFLLCTGKKPGSLHCGRCSPCLRIEKELHPDVLILKSGLQEDSQDAIKVETVREITHQMEISPLEGSAKVCIIDECHRMGTAAANAFLKTLEEPGENRYFLLLTTQVGSLLPTLLSRCLQFTFKPESEAPALPEETTAEFRKLFDDAKKTKNLSTVVSELDEKERCLQFLQFLQHYLRDALLGAEGVGHSLELSEKFDATLFLEGRLRSNANYGLMLESLLRQHFVGI